MQLLLTQSLLSSNMANFRLGKKRFEEGWPLLQTAVDRLINHIEEDDERADNNDKSIFTTHEYMSYYTTVFEICATSYGDSKQLHVQYKKVFEEYINSRVLPSLREKKDELLLRKLLRRWSNHKIMTRCLSRIFRYLEKFDITRWKLPSFEETGFFSFYDLVYDEMHKQVMDAILAMIDRKRAGEQINQILVNNTLAFYSEIGERTRKNDAKHFAEIMIKENAPFYYDEASKWIASSSFTDNTSKEDKMRDSPTFSSKKINLISSDGDVFGVDYDVALMSKTIEDAIKINPVGDIDSIPVSSVSSKLLAKVIEYCKKHSSKHMSDVDLWGWDVEFLDVDRGTLMDLVMSANYMNIKSLLDLTCQTVADMIKGKKPEEIRQLNLFPNQ